MMSLNGVILLKSERGLKRETRKRESDTRENDSKGREKGGG